MLYRFDVPATRKLTCFALATALLGSAGCSSVAPSKTASSAGTGAMVGGVGGAVVGGNSSMGSTTGALGGAAAGAIVGGIIGLAQEMKDRKEQDKLAQERAYQQDQAKRRQQEARMKLEMDEELAVAQGFQISDYELADAQKKTDDTTERLKRLRDERAAALNRKKTLDELHDRQLANEAEIARLEEELARLKGEAPAAAEKENSEAAKKTGAPSNVSTDNKTQGNRTTPEPPPKPGI
jgi:hypothetical protein